MKTTTGTIVALVLLGAVLGWSTPASATSVYSGAVNGLGAVANWEFNDVSVANGATAADSSLGGLNPGTYVNSGGLSLVAGPGFLGNAIQLSGSVNNGNYVSSTDNNFAFGIADRTVIAWIKTSQNPQADGSHHPSIFSYGTPNSLGRYFGLVQDPYNDNPTYNYPGYFSATQWGHAVEGGPYINDGSWHFVAVTTQGDTWTTYVDGTPSGSETLSGSGYSAFNTLSSGLSAIGGAATGNVGGDQVQWNGAIAGVAVFNTKLSAGNIQSLYNDAFTVPEPSTALLFGLGGLMFWRGYRRLRSGRAIVS